MNKERSVEELLSAGAKRDLAAFSEVYDRLAPRVYGLVARIVPPLDAEIILQQVFLRLWSEAETLGKSGASVVAWLVLNARGLALDRRHCESKDVVGGGSTEDRELLGKAKKPGRTRAKKRPVKALEKRSESLRPAVGHGVSIGATSHFPHACLPLAKEIELIDDRLALIHKAIHQLPDPQRQALDLAVYGGQSEVEIAAETGEPLGKAQRSLRAAITFVRHRQRTVCGTWAANI